MRDLVLFIDSKRDISHNLLQIVESLKSINQVIWVCLDYLDSEIQSSSCLTDTKHLNVVNRLAHARHTQHICIEITHVPSHFSDLNRHATVNRVLDTLCPILDSKKITNPTIWTSEFIVADICEHLQSSSLIYLCDKGHPSSDPVAEKQEQYLINHSDVIFGTSDDICSRFPAKKTYLLQQGVDLKLFCRPADRASDFPNNGRPTAGFYGNLDNSVDYQLLMIVALHLPHWNFVVLGYNSLPFYPLPKLDNVYYLGPKNHQTLPRYSQHWQASILPTLPSKHYSAAKHATLLEYLAVGAPIIATDHNVAGRFSKYVNIVENAREMSEALVHAAYEPKCSADIVFSDSWQVRSRYVDNILQVIPK